MVDKTKFDGGRAVMVKKDGASFADDFVPMDVHMYTWTPRWLMQTICTFWLDYRQRVGCYTAYIYRIYVYIYILNIKKDKKGVRGLRLDRFSPREQLYALQSWWLACGASAVVAERKVA